MRAASGHGGRSGQAADRQLPEAPVVASGEAARFRLDKGVRGKGAIVEQDAGRLLIADNNGGVRSVPVELTRRGIFD